MRGVDLNELSRSDVTLESKLVGQGGQLLALLGLSNVIAASDAVVNFEGSAKGQWRAPLRVTAKLSGADVDADVQGSAEPWAGSPKASLALAIRRANLAPLVALKPSDAAAQNVSLSSRLTLNGDKVTLEDIDSTLAGSRVRGRITLTLGAEKAVDGQIGMDAIELGPAFGLAVGTRGRDATDPLGRGVLQGWRGQLAFQALRGTLPGGVELRPISGTVKSDGQALTIDTIKGSVGGGEITADVDLEAIDHRICAWRPRAILRRRWSGVALSLSDNARGQDVAADDAGQSGAQCLGSGRRIVRQWIADDRRGAHQWPRSTCLRHCHSRQRFWAGHE